MSTQHIPSQKKRVPRGQSTESIDQTGQARLLTAEHLRQVQDLIALLRKNNLTELEIEQEGFRVRLRYEVGAGSAAGSLTEGTAVASQGSRSVGGESTPTEEETSGLVTITSPIVGTFYRSPSPDADPYVEEGDYVKKGQVLCIVEAMKLMNEIESETDGRIVKILAESTKPVEYGQPLFLIDPKARP